VGKGKVAENGKKISVHYTGTLKDGTKFDSSHDRQQPFPFELGTGKVIKGWDMGVVGMKVGGKRKLIIPSALAYKDRGVPGIIPPNSTLIFEVELLNVE
jgi:FKBP-type peptidyl-prolyl cis-trans isomerase